MSRPELSEVLAEVNQIRAEWGMKPLDSLPKGDRGTGNSCPLAHAFEAGYVGRTKLGGRSLGPVLTAFVAAFDSGDYPQLVA